MRKQLQSTTKSGARGVGGTGTMRAPAGRLTSKTAPQRNARGVTVAGRSSRAPRGNTVNTAGATAGRGGRGASSRMPAIRQGRGRSFALHPLPVSAHELVTTSCCFLILPIGLRVLWGTTGVGNANLSVSGPGRLSGRGVAARSGVGPGGRGPSGKLPHVAGSGAKGVRAVRQAW